MCNARIRRALPYALKPRHCRRVAALFASLHRTAPHIAKSSVARGERIVMIALREGQRSIVAESLDVRFDPHLGVIRRPLGATIEINVELNLQSPNVFLKTCELLVNRKLRLVHQSFDFVALAT